MQNWLLDSMYESQLDLIARGRKVDAAKVKEWIDNGPYSAEKAKAAGLIDAVEFKQDFDVTLKAKFGKDVVLDQKYGKKKEQKLDLSSPLRARSGALWGRTWRGQVFYRSSRAGFQVGGASCSGAS